MSRSKSTVRQRFALPVALTSFDRYPATTAVIQQVFKLLHGRNTH